MRFEEIANAGIAFIVGMGALMGAIVWTLCILAVAAVPTVLAVLALLKFLGV